MATPRLNTKSPTIKRILREAAELSTAPSPDLHAAPASDSNLFEWHFTLRGPPSSSFESGIYHGRIVLPTTYPLRPPSFRFLTPSGRFEVNREICLSISGHHEETWQPAWGIRTALVALRSFMETDAKGQLGGLETSEKERVRVAGESGRWKCAVCARSNVDIMKECEEAAKEAGTIEDTEVPKELVIATKEDLEKMKDSVEEAELAEGFVQTVPRDPTEPSTPARPAQGVPQPTGTRIQETIRQDRSRHAHIQAVQRVSQDGVPIWIDRAIAGLVICIVFMMLKIVLGY
ncbi:ubiquitin-conjugating enzyme/RWD-like protein [Calycina marina]|uniref:Ubiquitin-conjugating enzyme/RWD-like protein n=1 Tax=Calycina marina TaxID=1763456 RepID=A0A9P8CCW4_9HELO|nr:ubiquitin-conjugating enzyme/RWD-like protein [Calycina marina]